MSLANPIMENRKSDAQEGQRGTSIKEEGEYLNETQQAWDESSSSSTPKGLHLPLQ